MRTSSVSGPSILTPFPGHDTQGSFDPAAWNIITEVSRLLSLPLLFLMPHPGFSSAPSFPRTPHPHTPSFPQPTEIKAQPSSTLNQKVDKLPHPNLEGQE